MIENIASPNRRPFSNLLHSSISQKNTNWCADTQKTLFINGKTCLGKWKNALNIIHHEVIVRSNLLEIWFWHEHPCPKLFPFSEVSLSNSKANQEQNQKNTSRISVVMSSDWDHPRRRLTTFQSEFQDPKMQVLYRLRPYLVAMFQIAEAITYGYIWYVPGVDPIMSFFVWTVALSA